jgi:hypothetical protein
MRRVRYNLVMAQSRALAVSLEVRWRGTGGPTAIAGLGAALVLSSAGG